MEVSGHLVVPPVFNTGEAEYLGLAGSIPVHLRQFSMGEEVVVAQVDPRRMVPRTDVLMADPVLVAATTRHGVATVKAAVRAAQDRVRAGEVAPGDAVAAAREQLPARSTTLRPLLNATGVVVHTNIGRAPLSDAAVDAVVAAAAYVDVEYDTATGARARRGRGTLEALRAAVPAAGDALVVNNGAAALVLATTALAAGREVVVSRGEMVEIGDGFRLPDLIASTGARLREVGTTNRTRVGDYAAALGPDTGCILKVHPSNFRVEGFTSAASVAELATLGVPVVVDIGSGLLRAGRADPRGARRDNGARRWRDDRDGQRRQAARWPAGRARPRRGRDGRAAAAPPARARPAGRQADPRSPRGHACADRCPRCWTTSTRTPTPCACAPTRLAAAVAGDVVPVEGRVGGGGAPGIPLPGWAVALPEELAERLRQGEVGVVARVERGRCLVDLRCVPPDRDADVERAVLAARAPDEQREA